MNTLNVRLISWPSQRMIWASLAIILCVLWPTVLSPRFHAYLDDNFWRPQFVKTCAGVNWINNEWIAYCNKQYVLFRELDDRNWRPIEDDLNK